eukprot:jgi/Ulvmu1/12496/UM009_0149.1
MAQMRVNRNPKAHHGAAMIFFLMWSHNISPHLKQEITFHASGALIEDHVVSPDPDTCIMLRKPIGQQARHEATMRGLPKQHKIDRLHRKQRETTFVGCRRFLEREAVCVDSDRSMSAEGCTTSGANTTLCTHQLDRASLEKGHPQRVAMGKKRKVTNSIVNKLQDPDASTVKPSAERPSGACMIATALQRTLQRSLSCLQLGMVQHLEQHRFCRVNGCFCATQAPGKACANDLRMTALSAVEWQQL